MDIVRRVRNLFVRNRTFETSLSSRETLDDRRYLLARVRAIWIDGLLTLALSNFPLKTVDAERMADTGVLLEVKRPEEPRFALPSGTRMLRIYTSAQSHVILSGARGAGKTILLLQLAHDLLGRAEADSAFPLPVVFHLASWSIRHRTFSEWLIEELQLKYQAMKESAIRWVRQRQIVLLLDGLDEIDPSLREQCLRAIYDYAGEKNAPPFVLCCGDEELIEAEPRSRESIQVLIQSASRWLVDAYLSSANPLREAMEQDACLYELIYNPFMLNALATAYASKEAYPVPHNLPADLYTQQVLKDYVQQLFRLYEGNAYYSPQETVKWLTWLARQMKNLHISEFYLEQTHIDSLPVSRTHVMYHVLSGLMTREIRGGKRRIGVLFRYIMTRLFRGRTRALPLRMVLLLKYATMCRLLFQVGDGYMFAHPILLDYFADLDVEV